MKICVLPGDGIGIEIMAQAVRVLKALDLGFELEEAQLGGGAVDATGSPFPEATQKLALAADAVLHAVLSRVTLPLAEVMGLKAGDVLPLPNAAIDRLEVQGLDGRRVATAKLGQQRGMRAIRLQVGAGGGGIDAAATAAIGATVAQHPAVSGHANQPPAVAGDSSGLARTGT